MTKQIKKTSSAKLALLVISYYAATTFATCASLAVFILLDPAFAASAPVNVPVLTRHSLPSGSKYATQPKRCPLATRKVLPVPVRCHQISYLLDFKP
ncbi:hypothetical protein ABH966_003307 [Lysinibacillus sp. RC46]|uniref:hypothetical protein n=1 Tax=Lysinibacillus sp. RC46 TaxID=3156295 RepID=UPI0035193692